MLTRVILKVILHDRRITILSIYNTARNWGNSEATWHWFSTECWARHKQTTTMASLRGPAAPPLSASRETNDDFPVQPAETTEINSHADFQAFECVTIFKLKIFLLICVSICTYYWKHFSSSPRVSFFNLLLHFCDTERKILKIKNQFLSSILSDSL